MDPSLLVGLVVFLPLVMGIATPLLTRRVLKGRPEPFVAVVCAVLAVAVVLLATTVLRGETVTLGVGYNLGIDEILFFSVDTFSMFLGIIVVALWLMASIHAIEYMEHEHARGRYSACSLLALTGLLGTFFAGNLITLLFFFEMITLSCYVLVAHEQTEASRGASLLYLFIGLAAGLFLLLGIVASTNATGSMSLARVSAFAGGAEIQLWVLWLFTLGFGIKAGLFPVHVWLPLAHPVAPSPASALLSGIVIKAGAYGIFRVTSVFWASPEAITPMLGSFEAILVLAMIGIFLGSAVAMAQTDIKAMLAYSSISQIAYVFLGFALLTPRGMTGGLVHIFNHALIKSCLFLCAGVFVHKAKKRHVNELGGLGRKMPITVLCFTVAALAMIGIPPLNGFVTKWMLALGALDVAEVGYHAAPWGYAAVAVLLLSSLMNLIYYGPILYRLWFAEGDTHHDDGHEEEGAARAERIDPTWRMWLPISLLAAGIVFFGVFPRWPLGLAETIMRELMGGLF